jgi:hypothetical protein
VVMQDREETMLMNTDGKGVQIEGEGAGVGLKEQCLFIGRDLKFQYQRHLNSRYRRHLIPILKSSF